MHEFITPLNPMLLTSTGFSLVPHSARGVRIKSELIRAAHRDRYHSCSKCLKSEPLSISLIDPRSRRSTYPSDFDITYDRFYEELALAEAVKYGASTGRQHDALPYGSQCDILLMAMLTNVRSKRREEFDEEFDELFDRHDRVDDEPNW
jgi:hypothetical protein